MKIAATKRILTLFIMFACAVLMDSQWAMPTQGPVPNPFLVNSYNNQTHWNCANNNYALHKKLNRLGFFEIVPGSYDVLPNDTFAFSVMSDVVQGTPVYWAWNGFSLSKFYIDTINTKIIEIDRIFIDYSSVPNYKPVTGTQRLLQAQEVKKFLDKDDNQGLYDYMAGQPNRMLESLPDQRDYGAIYMALGTNDVIYAVGGHKLYKFEQADPTKPFSPMNHNYTVADIGSAAGIDRAIALNLTYNGYIVIVTQTGWFVVANRETLKVTDSFRVNVKKGENIFKSVVTGPGANGGETYFVSSQNAYCVVIDAEGKIHQDAATGAWKVSCEEGTIDTGLKVGLGSGSTPAFLGYGPNKDNVVVVVDGATKMRLTAYWRGAIPAGFSDRIVDQIEVDYGPGIGITQHDNAVLVYKNYAFCVNATTFTNPPGISTSRFYVATVSGATVPAARGVGMYKWNHARHKWGRKWINPNISAPTGVAGVIIPDDNMVVVDGYLVPHWNERYHIGMDLDTGNIKLLIKAGSNPLFNDMLGIIKITEEGGFLINDGAFGTYILNPLKMIPLPPSNLQGFQEVRRYQHHTGLVNVLSWDIANDNAHSEIYLSTNLTKPLAIIPGTGTVSFEHYSRKAGIADTYYIYEVDNLGNRSRPSVITVPS